MNRKTTSVAVLSVALLAAFVGCSKNKSSGSDSTVQAPEATVETVALQVVATDASTGLPVKGAEVVFSGALASSVIDVEGASASDAVMADGFDAFHISGGKTGKLVVSAKAAGYLAVSQSVDIVNGENVVKLSLVNLAAGAKGVDVVTATATSGSDGVVAATQTVKADVGTVAEAATLTLAQGIALKDESGKPVSGELTLTLATFAPSEPTAMEAITSDLVVTTASGAEAVSVVAAYIDLSIASTSGAKVKTLVPAATLEVALDPSAVNPETGSAYVPGDKLSLWSNSEGVVKYEGEATVLAGNKISVSISHLSQYWVSKDVPTCGSNAPKLVLNGAKGSALELSAFATSGGYMASMYNQGKDTLVLDKFPSSSPNLQISAMLGTESVASLSASKVGCGAVVSVPVALPAVAKLTAKVLERCEQDTKVSTVMPSSPVAVFTAAGNYVAAGQTDKDGLKSFELTVGKGYNVIAASRSSGKVDTLAVTFTADKTVEFPFDIKCQELTGAE